MNYQMILKNFQRGLWSERQVRMAVKKGVITDAQANAIIGSRQGAANFAQNSEWNPGVYYLAGDTVKNYICLIPNAGREPSKFPNYWVISE